MLDKLDLESEQKSQKYNSVGQCLVHTFQCKSTCGGLVAVQLYSAVQIPSTAQSYAFGSFGGLAWPHRARRAAYIRQFNRRRITRGVRHMALVAS